jgi:uncharacterized protein (TIGR03084 family)
MKALAQAVHEECAALDGFLATLARDDWGRRTAFFGWTVADEVMHLHLVDLFGLQAMRDPAGFAATVREVRAQQAQGIELSAQMRARFGQLSADDLRGQWRATWSSLCDDLATEDPKRRISWFGPDMSVRSFASARQMEVWAHGQDIFDLFAVRRENTDLIRNICDLGVRTFGWSFQNRGEQPPAHPPRVTLTSPAGAVWSWNGERSEAIEGSAEDFALVVTQRRNVADTGLLVEGPGAKRWMAIAQCFAGAPETGPAPGVRLVASAKLTSQHAGR